jgi:hypothetical protein
MTSVEEGNVERSTLAGDRSRRYGRLRAAVSRVVPPEPSIRLLVVASFIASIGFGLYLSGSAVYFVRSVSLQPSEVGVGLSVGGLAGLLTAVPIGHLSDRYHPRNVSLVLTLCQAVLLLLATQVTGFGTYVALMALLGTVEAGANISRSALVATLLEGGSRVRLAALTRSVFNAGFTLGVVGAGFAIGVDTRAAYLSLILGNAAAACIVCVLYARLPAVKRRAAEEGEPAAAAVRTRRLDLPYLLLGQVSGLTQLGDVVLSVGLPLWIVTQTSASRQLAAWIAVLNTALIIAFQVRAARAAETMRGAARLQRMAFLVLAGACLIIGITGELPTIGAIILLLAAVAALSLGEMWGEGAKWALRFGLAPNYAQGRYGGVFSLGQAVPMFLGPVLVTAAPQHLGGLGWLVVTAVFVVGLLLSRPATEWALRTRQGPVDDG